MNDIWSVCKPKLVPNISNKKLEEMITKIKPVYNVGDGRFREIITDEVDRRGVAFTWEPKLGRAVRIYRGGLNEVTTITFHTWGYYGFFKPTLAECYACIRKFVPNLDPIRFFWLDTREMDHRNIIGDFHWCKCVLFGEEETNVIDAEWEAFEASCR